MPDLTLSMDWATNGIQITLSSTWGTLFSGGGLAQPLLLQEM